MGRKLGVQYPEAIDHVITNRDDRREPILHDDLGWRPGFLAATNYLLGDLGLLGG